MTLLYKKINFYFRKILKEWLLLGTIIGFITTSIILKRFPSYSINDFEVLFILFMLFVIIKGIENSGFFDFILKFIKLNRFLGLKLVVLTSILSMFVTNDVALLIVVPLTLNLEIENKWLIIILEALSANAGSALTPFGNPQNIFIYWFYKIDFFEFLKTIYPFTIFSMTFIAILSFFVKIKHCSNEGSLKKEISKKLYIYLFFLLLFILIIFRILPIYMGIIPLGYTLIFSRKNLKIDYILLGIFFFFFGLTDNLKEIIHFEIDTSHHIFILSSLISQFISNVPATLFLSDFTQNWKALLWGVNTGGYGNIIGSLANLIAYRFYITKYEDKTFFIKFNFIGFIFFFITILFYLKFIS